MSLVEAFLLATSAAYLACFIYTAMGWPPLIGMGKRVQMVFYWIAFLIFVFVSWNTRVFALNFILGVFYGFAAMGSFIGWPQRWAAYWKDNPEEGSDAGQIGMALWDLALSVCFFYLAFR